MDCKQFRSCISLFLRDELNIDMTESFLEHKAMCKECSEELEIMHLLEVGMSQLDDVDKEETYDFNGILKNRLFFAEKRCRKARAFERFVKIVVLLVNCIVLLGLIYQVYELFGGKEWLANYF